MRALKALKALGMDGAVAYTFLARAVGIVGSTGTVLLIARFLSPVEQGYYYTLLSLVALQVVFEMGFSFVIQQLAAHECVHLEFHADGRVSGDERARARLASALQLSVRWYTVAALAMGLILLPLGIFFFARHSAAAQVAWQGPWLTAVIASAAGLWCIPFYSFLEGCGQVRAVAAMRLRQALAAAALAWTAMLLHCGLYAPALAIAGYLGAGFLFLLSRRNLLTGLLRHPARESAIQWNREVWPFQWRIAVSWLCSYFAVQAFIPILFALRGPVEAGQMGMSLSITGYMTTLALAWSTTKTTPFGSMIARREFEGLDRLFRRTLGQSLAVFAVLALAACCLSALLPVMAPSLASRMVSPQLFAVLVLGAGANCVVQSLAALLRSFKSEPFLVQSLAVAGLTLLLARWTAPQWGNAGDAMSYLFAAGVIGLPIALAIFARSRRNYLAIIPPAPGADRDSDWDRITKTNGRETHMTRYERGAVMDPLRKLCRIADFVLLLTVLRVRKKLPSFWQMRHAAFIELGPGPTRLAFVKRLFFRRVFFVDQSDFGIPDPGLRVADLEQIADAEKIVTELCGISGSHAVILFADHCLEHLTECALQGFLHAVRRCGWIACFRVPNVLSPTGNRAFARDATHCTSFDPEMRVRIKAMGLGISPWMRWYRPRLLFKALAGRLPLMAYAEEIAICAAPGTGCEAQLRRRKRTLQQSSGTGIATPF